MSHFVLLLALQGAGEVIAQPHPARLRARTMPVQLGTPLIDPAPPAPAAAVLPVRPADMVLTWNETALLVIKTEGTPPPLAARNLAIVHAAIFDAVNSILQKYTPYLVRDPAQVPASPEAAAAVADHCTLTGLYPRKAAFLNRALDRSLQSVPEGPAKAAGVALGQRVAEQFLAWRSTDGADRQVVYLPPRGVGQWQQTPPDHAAALLPQWPAVKCFCMRSAAQFRPPAPPPLNSVEYAQAFNEVKALGGIHSSARTAEQTEIAWFWLDGQGTVTPPGHWNRIAQTVAQLRGNSLDENARLFALLNLAMADAGISCWDCKYNFNFWRPVHAIWYADRDGNPATAPDLAWTPLLPTPPFPSYTSGHSSFSSAAATVLACFFGADELPFSATSEDRPGVTRSFVGFSAAAREAGLSRIYGGIHYSFDNEAGLAAGRSIGDYVCKHYLLPRAEASNRPGVGFAVRRK